MQQHFSRWSALRYAKFFRRCLQKFAGPSDIVLRVESRAKPYGIGLSKTFGFSVAHIVRQSSTPQNRRFEAQKNQWFFAVLSNF